MIYKTFEIYEVGNISAKRHLNDDGTPSDVETYEDTYEPTGYEVNDGWDYPNFKTLELAKQYIDDGKIKRSKYNVVVDGKTITDYAVDLKEAQRIAQLFNMKRGGIEITKLEQTKVIASTSTV